MLIKAALCLAKNKTVSNHSLQPPAGSHSPFVNSEIREGIPKSCNLLLSLFYEKIYLSGWLKSLFSGNMLPVHTLLLDPNNEPQFTPTQFTFWSWSLLVTDGISCEHETIKLQNLHLTRLIDSLPPCPTVPKPVYSSTPNPMQAIDSEAKCIQMAGKNGWKSGEGPMAS